MCLYYRPGALCFNVELDVNTIAVVLATGVSIYLAIKTGVVSSSNKRKGDQEVEIKDEKTGDKFYGDCASAYAEETALLADCGSAQSKWIEVPTGASFALESVYYYDESGTGGTNANMITSHCTDCNNQPYLTGVISGGEDLRVWIFA